MKKVIFILLTICLFTIFGINSVFADESSNTDYTKYPDETYKFYVGGTPSQSPIQTAIWINMNLSDGILNVPVPGTGSLTFDERFEEVDAETGMAAFRSILNKASTYGATNPSTTNRSSLNFYKTIDIYNKTTANLINSFSYLETGNSSTSFGTVGSNRYGLPASFYQNSIAYAETASYDPINGTSSVNIHLGLRYGDEAFLYTNDALTIRSNHWQYAYDADPGVLHQTTNLMMRTLPGYLENANTVTNRDAIYKSSTNLSRGSIMCVIDHFNKIAYILEDSSYKMGLSISNLSCEYGYNYFNDNSLDNAALTNYRNETYGEMFDYVPLEDVFDNWSRAHTIWVCYEDEEIIECELIDTVQVSSTINGFLTGNLVTNLTSGYPENVLNNIPRHPLAYDSALYYWDNKSESGINLVRNPFQAFSEDLNNATQVNTVNNIRYASRRWYANGTYFNTNNWFMYDTQVPLPESYHPQIIDDDPTDDDEEEEVILPNVVFGSTCKFGTPVQTIYPRELDLSSDLGSMIKSYDSYIHGDEEDGFFDLTNLLYFNLTNTLNDVTVSGYIFLSGMPICFDTYGTQLKLVGNFNGWTDSQIDDYIHLYMATSDNDDSSDYREISYAQFFGKNLPNFSSEMIFQTYPFDSYNSSGNKITMYKYVSYACFTWNGNPMKAIYYPIIIDEAGSFNNAENGYTIADYVWNNLRSASEGTIEANEFNNLGNETGTNKPYTPSDVYVPLNTQDFSFKVSELINIHDQLDTFNGSINKYINDYSDFFNSDFDLLTNSNFMTSATNLRDLIDSILSNDFIKAPLYVVLSIALVLLAIR